MKQTIPDRLSLLSEAATRRFFCGTLFGVEKETLRVDPAGRIARSQHPNGLGSALTNPLITTDYSEALLEFITEPLPSPVQVLERLNHIQTFVCQNLQNDEVLWSNSMPCQLGEDSEIPVAQYGTSNVGRMKSVYRVGLGHRYGRKMQTIAGIHFNYSVPDAIWATLKTRERSIEPLQEFKTRGYMGMVRNFRRWYWLLIYLMGASPAICRSFVSGREHQLQPLGDDEHTLHTPFGTSLRMGDLGYQSSAQEDLYVCYNDLASYIATLKSALTKNYPEYEQIGEFNEAGERIQLNGHILQIENEFYSAIRPKQTARSGETQLKALARRGVEYIEVRCLDLNPFQPAGLDLQQMLFLETFLLVCLIEPSAATSLEESNSIGENHRQTVYRGRDPELKLERGGEQISLRDWGSELLAKCRDIAIVLDQEKPEYGYTAAVDAMQARLNDSAKTPSAQVLKAISDSGQTYFGWAMAQSKMFTEQMNQDSLPAEAQAEFEAVAARSIGQQEEMERASGPDFETYVADYFAQYRTS